MARGRKKQVVLTVEEQLNVVNSEIKEYESQLKELKLKRKALENQLKEEQKEKMYKAVLESGKTIEDILAALSNDDKE